MSTESGRVEAREEASETGRLEAFSDGVFAIAVTLLVLDLHVPLGEEIRHGGLIRTLLAQWPIYLADALSFITILIFWVNHHATFKHITRTNQAFLILNGLLLLAISVIPFTTALLAEYIQRQERKAVEVVYSGTFVVAAVVYNRLWIYATRDRRLTSPDADMHTIDGITRQFHRGLAAASPPTRCPSWWRSSAPRSAWRSASCWRSPPRAHRPFPSSGTPGMRGWIGTRVAST